MDDKRQDNSPDPEAPPRRRPFERGPERGIHADRSHGRPTARPSRFHGTARPEGRPLSRGGRADFNPGNRTEDGQFRPRKPFGERKGPNRFSSKSCQKNKPAIEEAVIKPRIVSDKQITEGKFMGKKIETLDLPKFKTTSRRLREVFFRILGKKVRGRRFLDLRCGVGTLGIEALSRGAGLATFVDRSARMISITRKNLETFEIKVGHTETLEIEAMPFLKRTEKEKRKWDVVFVGISEMDDSEEMLSFLKRGVAVTKGSAVVIEHASALALPERTGRLRRRKIVVQGDVTMTFYEFK